MGESRGYTEIRTRLVELWTESQARYALGRNVHDGIPYEQAIYDLLHDRIAFPVPEDGPKIREMLARPAAMIKRRIHGINERLFMPYDIMEREIDIAAGLIREMDTPDKATVINELLRQEDGFREFAESRDNIVRRLYRIARRRGFEYAMHQRVRDGALRAEFPTGKKYAGMMMQGFESVIGSAYAEPARIRLLGKAQQSERIPLSVQSVVVQMSDEKEEDKWLDASLDIRLARMFVKHEKVRIWGEKVEA